MATRSLGQLTLDLVAKIGGFTQGMTQAERVADQKTREIAKKNAQRAKEVEKAWAGAAKFISVAFAGISIAGLFRTFTQESIEAQNEQAQLAAVLRSTGEAAGYSADQLNRMAAQMAGSSTFGEGEINKAQTRLLSYTGIVGEQFPKALQAAMDMATRLGTTVEQSAETIGKALDIPSQGLTALQKQGFRFTEEQKKAVEQLEKTGQVAQAQQVILDALSTAYGGAAQAARDTFGGAITALQEELRTLMTGSDGSLEGARESIEELTATLASPQTKAAFAALTDALASIVSFTVKAISETTRFAQFMGESFARAIHGSADPIERTSERIEELESKLAGLRQAMRGGDNGSESFRRMQANVATVTAELDRAKAAREDLLRTFNAPMPAPAASGGASGIAAPTPEQIRALAEANKAAEEAEKRAKDAAKASQAYLENLRKQVQATEELTAVEAVLRDIQAGRVQLVGGVTRQTLTDLAAQIDAAKELEVVEKARLDLANQIADENQRRDEQAAESVEKLIEGNQALRDEIALLGADADARQAVEQARISSAIALKEEALAAAQLAEASPLLINALEAEIALLRERQELLGKKGDRERAIEEIKEYEKFALQAQKNIQDALGDTFYNAMQGNFDNIGDAFVQMLQRMVAEAIAADLAGVLFGKKGSGSSGSTTGVLSDLIMAFASSYGGGRANGGPVQPGSFYEVNERGPELLDVGGRQYLMMGNEAGRVTPASSGGTGGAAGEPAVVVNITNNSSAQVRTQERQQGSGKVLEVTILDAVARDIAGGGTIASAMQSTYGLSRGPGAPRRSG